MMSKTVAIHQPNFFPWLGYFDKIARSDIFVFLDDVQFPKTGGSWSNRVKLLSAGEARWVTASIDRNYHGMRQIREMHFLATNPWRQDLVKSLQTNYKKHPFYAETMAIIEPLVMSPESNIAEYNIHAVTRLAGQLGLDVQKFRRSSDFGISASSNELLCALVLRTGGGTYMCGGGADGYQDETVFARLGVQLRYQNFIHPVYSQVRQQAFIPGLSLIDAVMNLGWLEARSLLESQR